MKNFIAGEYRQQREYKSFTPSLVNRYFVWENPQINILMARAMQLLGELNAYAELIPDVDFFIQMTITKEARDSNLLEGTRTELDEVVLLLPWVLGQRTLKNYYFLCTPNRLLT